NAANDNCPSKFVKWTGTIRFAEDLSMRAQVARGEENRDVCCLRCVGLLHQVLQNRKPEKSPMIGRTVGPLDPPEEYFPVNPAPRARSRPISKPKWLAKSYSQQNSISGPM